MAFLNVTTILTGEVGVAVELSRIACDDAYADIITAGYLSPLIEQGYSFPDGSFILINSPEADSSGTYQVSYSNGLPVLVAPSIPGVGTASTKTASDNTKTIVASVTAPTTIGQFPQFNDITGTIGNSGIVVARALYTGFNTPDVSSNLIGGVVTITAAELAAGGLVPIITSATGKQYRILTMRTQTTSTDFSGGGGDRNLTITDGTTTYSIIPALTLQTINNYDWGNGSATAFPYNGSPDTFTVAGQNLRALYSGGATDYSAGSLLLAYTAIRVA